MSDMPKPTAQLELVAKAEPVAEEPEPAVKPEPAAEPEPAEEPEAAAEPEPVADPEPAVEPATNIGTKPVEPVVQVKPSGFKMITVTMFREDANAPDLFIVSQGEGGVLVRFLGPEAERAGLLDGDWVDNINGSHVQDPQQTSMLLRAYIGRVTVTVMRPPHHATALAPPSGVALSITAEELLCATEDLLFLLRAVPPCLRKRGPELTRALWRYEKIWLPLAALSFADGSTVVPPPDVAWVWLCHQLAPERYVEDVTALCGSVPTRLPSDRQRCHVQAPAPQRAILGLLYTNAEYGSSAKRWEAYCESHSLGAEPFWVPYAPRVSKAPAEAAPSAPDASFVSRLGYDVAAAVERQSDFNYQVRACRSPMTCTEPAACAGLHAVHSHLLALSTR